MTRLSNLASTNPSSDHLANIDEENDVWNPNPAHQDPNLTTLDVINEAMLRQLTGTDQLSTVTSVGLHVAASESGLQTLGLLLPNLRELFLDDSRISSLRDLGTCMTGLQVLSVKRCGMKYVDGGFCLPALQELYAAYNMVENVTPCTSLQKLQILDLEGNMISDLVTVSFLSLCPHLHSLTLRGNPVSQQPSYRLHVKLVLSQLITLDSTALTVEMPYNDGADVSEHDVIDSTIHEPSMHQYDTPARSSLGASAPTSEFFSDFNTHSLGMLGTSCFPQAPPVAAEEALNTSSTLYSDSATAMLFTPVHDESNGTTLFSSACSSTASSGSETSRSSSGYCSTSQEVSQVELVDLEDEPSLLTSGQVVCGNLSMALHKKRQSRRGVWSSNSSTPSEIDGKKCRMPPQTNLFPSCELSTQLADLELGSHGQEVHIREFAENNAGLKDKIKYTRGSEEEENGFQHQERANKAEKESVFTDEVAVKLPPPHAKSRNVGRTGQAVTDSIQTKLEESYDGDLSSNIDSDV